MMDFLRRLKLGQYVARKWVRSMFVYPKQTLEGGPLTYDAYWDKKRPPGNTITLSPAERRRAEIISTRIGKNAVTVGDIGSGPGVVLRAIIDACPGSTGVAFDSSERALDEARKLGLVGEILDITVPGAIDTVRECDYYIVLEVLEHIPNSEVVLHALVKKAKKGVFFSVPNTGFLTHRFRLLFGKAPAQWIHMPNEHLRFWTIPDMRWWMRALGFKHAHITPYQGAPGLRDLWPNLFAEGMVVSVEKRDL